MKIKTNDDGGFFKNIVVCFSLQFTLTCLKLNDDGCGVSNIKLIFNESTLGKLLKNG